MQTKDKFLLWSLSIIIAVIFGIIFGKYYFSKTEIQIKEKIVYKTEYKTKIEYVNNQENFNALYKCYQSPINFKEKTENEWLIIHAEDACKSSDIKYKIGTKGDWKVYAAIAGVGAAGGGYLVYRILK